MGVITLATLIFFKVYLGSIFSFKQNRWCDYEFWLIHGVGKPQKEIINIFENFADISIIYAHAIIQWLTSQGILKNLRERLLRCKISANKLKDFGTYMGLVILPMPPEQGLVMFDKHEYTDGIFRSVILVCIFMLQVYINFSFFLKNWLTESILIFRE